VEESSKGGSLRRLLAEEPVLAAVGVGLGGVLAGGCGIRSELLVDDGVLARRRSLLLVAFEDVACSAATGVLGTVAGSSGDTVCLVCG
jgi:hypothetical protein